MDYLDLYESMVLSRLFERKVEEEFKKGTFCGTTHLSIGQEAAEVGLVKALDEKDWIMPTHRGHTYNLARATKPEKMFLELFGAKGGVCKGIGGSMHMTDISTYNLGASAVVAAGIPIAGGVALALKRQKSHNISVSIFGDGATSRGSLHETMNMASVFNLPILFFLENNHYGMSASAAKVISTSELYKRGASYNIASERVDGNDILAVIASVKKARQYIIREHRPYFIEADTYRLCGHSKSDNRKYRTRLEEEEWEKKDPIKVFASFLLDHGLISENDLEKAYEKVSSYIENEWNSALEKKDEKLTKDELCSLVLAPGCRNMVIPDKAVTHQGSYREAINEALGEILHSCPSSYLIGEDIGLYGGCFSVTGDLYKTYPNQIIETPVSEEGFTGIAIGSALLGERPICEVMYGDFLTLTSDQLVNHAAKMYFMSAGQLRCPLIMRAPSGGGTGHGVQHSQSLENMFMNIPGLIVVAPSDPYSAKALLKAAALENNPVLFIESKSLYGTIGEIGGEDTYLPIGKCIFTDRGGKTLVISYSRAMALAKKALLDEKVSFLDLATLRPVDRNGIKKYSAKFDNILLLSDTPYEGGILPMVLSCIDNAERKNIRILTALDCPVPFSPDLERTVLLTSEKIKEEYEAFNVV